MEKKFVLLGLEHKRGIKGLQKSSNEGNCQVFYKS
jgi:hypothetical protein